MTSEYGTIEIDWQPVTKPNGEHVTFNDGTGAVEATMRLLPKLQAEFGGWAFEDLDGLWNINKYASPAIPITAIQVGVEIEVTLGLGKFNQNGKRYQNINKVTQIEGATATAQPQQDWLQGNNAPAPAAPLSGDGRNESIREQAFFNNLNPDILAQLPAEQQEALLVAYFDTGMLMLRDSVRKRALAKLNESELPEIPDTPMVNAAIAAGGVVTSVESVTPTEDVEQLPW